MMFLSDKPRETIETVYGFCEAVGLPTTLADIGLGGAADARLMQVAERACATGETIYNEPVEVTPRAVFAALKTADAYGRHRQGANGRVND